MVLSFSDKFLDLPKGLSPDQEMEHIIELESETNPIMNPSLLITTFLQI